MAISTTTSVIVKTVEGDHRKVYGLVALSGTYVTGGFDWTVNELGNGYVKSSDPLLLFAVGGASGSYYLGFYDSDTNKVAVIDPTTGAEVAAATDLTGVEFPYTAVDIPA